jgi:hypothetical protein
MSSSANPFARTERSDPTLPRHISEGCALAHETHRMLVGDGERVGMFERIRELERLMKVGIATLAVPLWIALAMHAWDRFGP